MLETNRRTTLKLLGGAALAVTAMPVLPLPAAAQQEDLVVPNSLQNFKRGTIHSMHPEVRSFTIVWEDLGRVKMKAADLVTNYPALKPGQIVDSHWYDYMDFLIVKKTPETTARAKAMLAQGARLQGIPGAQQRIRLWNMDGMVTKVDLAANVVYLINASGGEPDKPAPDSGEVIQMPPIVTPAGKAALQTIKVGDTITTVFSQQTAIDATIIR
jgi:Cu/Ag efflux protein CusF